MSLDYNLTRIPEETKRIVVDGEPRLNPVTEALIFATMAVGMGEIKEANAAEFYSRVHFYEKLTGSFVTDRDGPRPITPDDIKAHIGLSTNVFYESPGRWRSRIAKLRLTDYANAYNTSTERNHHDG